MYRKIALDHNARDSSGGAILKVPKELSFRSAAFSREESAVSLPAANRFLADKSGFGMTRVGFVA